MLSPRKTNPDPNLNLAALPSDEKFGWFFCVVFIFIAGWFAWGSSFVWSAIFGGASAVCAFLALATPNTLRPLNRNWYSLGVLLGKIINPMVLGIIFFVLITPVSLVTRLFGRDELKIRKRSVESYWVHRAHPSPPPESFRNQF